MASALVLGTITTGAAGTSLVRPILKTLTMTKLKITTLGILVAAGLATTILLQQRSLNLLRQDNAALRQQNQELDRLRSENERLKKPQVDPQEIARLQNDQKELLKLRGRIGLMRDQLAKFQSPSNVVSTDGVPPASGFQATAHATVTVGDTLVTGGWSCKSGKRTLVFVTPELDSADPGIVRVRASFVQAPVELWDSLEMATVQSTNQKSTAQTLLTASQCFF